MQPTKQHSSGRLRSIRILMAFWVGAWCPCLGATAVGSIAGHPSAADTPTVFVGAKVFPAPDAPAIEEGVVVIAGTRISAVGTADSVPIPANARVIDARGLSLLAGFWNCHVHFTEPKWQDAATRSADELNQQLQQMLTSYGFTTVVDLASPLSNTAALRARIESGEIAGPRILTAGAGLYPPDGVPYYVTESLPEIAPLLPTPATAEEAAKEVQRNLEGGANVIKLFLVTGVRRPDRSIELREMPRAVVRAAVRQAHKHGRLVFAHPSTRKGLDLAINGGVDVLAHTIQDTENWDAAVIHRLRATKIALIPTLTLFSEAAEFPAVLNQVRSYVAAGGDVLFGTDVGFLPDYSAVGREFRLMRDAGLTFPQLVAALTTAPARRFGVASQTGRVVPGADADLVLVAGDPSQDSAAFLRVRHTLRAGRTIYTSR